MRIHRATTGTKGDSFRRIESKRQKRGLSGVMAGNAVDHALDGPAGHAQQPLRPVAAVEPREQPRQRGFITVAALPIDQPSVRAQVERLVAGACG